MGKVIGLYFCFLGIHLFGHGSSTGEKIYVDPERIHIESRKILVDMGESSFPVSMVAIDSNGIYVIRDGVQMVVCSECEKPFDIDNQSSQCPHPWYVRNY